MNAGSILWLGGAMLAFVAANSVLRTYATNSYWPILAGALGLFLIGNLMMIRLMRESGLAVIVSISSILQLVLIGVVAFAIFGERPTGLQLAGMVLGILAVTMIAWPQGGRG